MKEINKRKDSANCPLLLTANLSETDELACCYGQYRGLVPDMQGYNMANVISDETIEYVGILAKLELNAEEKEQAKADMASMLDYIDKLNELDTEGVEPMSHVFPVNNVFREDVVTNGDDRENILKNAPEEKNGMFNVPKTFD